MARLIASYCARGPYRHVRALLDQPDAWFPWGYYKQRVEPGLKPQCNDLVELWEIDDTRQPTDAAPVGMATVDYVSCAAGYVALTLRRTEALIPLSAPAEVVRAASRRHLLASGPLISSVEPAPLTALAQRLAG